MTETIALVFAGGTASASLTGQHPLPKALVDLGGRPLVGHVVDALTKSGCRNVFVFHDDGDPVEKAIGPIPGVVCVPRIGAWRGYAEGIYFALFWVAERFAAADLARYDLLFVPCDTPLATADDYASLVDRFRTAGTEAAMCLAPVALVRDHLPGRRFPVVRLPDRADSVVLPVVCLQGSLIRSSGGKLGFARWTQREIDQMARLVRNAREQRAHRWLLPVLVYVEVLRRIDSPATAVALVGAVVRYAAGRLDSARALDVIHSLSGVRLGLVDSDRWTFSADVDSPADLGMAEAELARRPTGHSTADAYR